MFIEDLGWNAYFEALWNETGETREECVPARVVSQHRGLWRVAGDFAECWAEPSGKFRAEAEAGGDWPAVGDWVGAEIFGGGDRAIIQGILQRRSCFARKVAGKAIAPQVIAANVDVALIVAALDGDFNVRRIERYVAQCWESGARPAIVLNKADACADLQRFAASVEEIALGVPVFVVSAKTGAGVDVLERSFEKGQTVVFLGSSGVGKSTLVNRLLRDEQQRTQPVRESDSRGRHTTTWQQLFVLPSGAMVIDTPGLRELQIWSESGDFSQTFADIQELGKRCHFRDCRHEGEPGCAVQEAIAAGGLDAGRLENQRKLEREQQFLLRKMDPEIRKAEKNRNKILHREVRRMYQNRDKGKN
jgi:ribosome biogenesis GTPase / thiamine phosphate phosphatase